MWTKSRGSRRRWRFGRKIQRGTRVRTWRRQRKFTIICGCFLRAAERHFASSVEHRFERIARTKSLRGFCRLRRAGGFTSCTSFESPRPRRRFRNEAPRKPPALRLRKSFVKHCSIFRSVVSTGFTRRDESTNFLSGNAARRRFSKPVYVLVDRLAVNPESRARLVDSIEICYREGQGEAILEFVADDAGNPPSGSRSTNDSNARMTAHFTRNPSPGSSPSNNPYGACPRCQGIRQHHRLRLESGRPRSEQVARRRRHRAVDETSLPRTFPGSKKMGARARNSDERAVAATHRRTAPA